VRIAVSLHLTTAHLIGNNVPVAVEILGLYVPAPSIELAFYQRSVAWAAYAPRHAR